MNRRNHRHNRYSRPRSLWEHSKPFRQLSYWMIFVGVLFLLGTWSAHQQNHAQGVAAAQSIPTPAPHQPTPQTVPIQPAIAPPVPVQTAQPVQNGLSNYPLANKTLGNNVNPHNTLPLTGFDAYYMNEDQPSIVVAKENVAQVAMNYAYAEFHNIPSEKFLGYWVGKLRVPQDGLYEISANLSWSSVRVLIDKHIIVDKNNSFPSQTIYLTKGEYKLEVEYNNNWHTVGFQLNVKPHSPSVSRNDLRQNLASLNLPNNTVVYAASVYESNNQGNRINIQTPNHETRPYILLLSSYDSVNWEVVGTTRPVLILYDNKSNVRASGLSNTLAVDYSIHYNAFARQHDCHCSGSGHFTCSSSEHKNANEILQDVQSTLGYPLVGFSGEYATSALTVPQASVNANFLNEIKLAEQKRAAEEKACQAQVKRGFEDLVR
ncbi:PA14 domain-containing protein [Alysiella filiformis]|uniref:PA14 domain-containing protein n=1 Tax=Alysiella filiformis DSM 16848 TaxID=1120981 RepID=A0A286EBC0_9NEIS|nr:PA14 domain-containing protein [Alysiella filiformis]QMT32213.1 hypothetical protein H3L97_05105 [Alysiella filiformis]UBQ56867.1 hypothetical protein JF568_03580 [Alysiella filiformis DSM 16848]SOD68134.1 PA14 domain-containing protein [Alysiella filiformis DSM 16848]